MKIVTYNIHKGMDSNNRLTLTKMGLYLKQLNCDVICLQEVLYPQFLALKAVLNMDGVFAPNVKKVNMIYGICTFTTFKMLNSNHFFLTSKKEQRGALCITIDAYGRIINVINTHLGLDRQERAKQLDEIIDYRNRLVGIVVLCGDFNEKNVFLSMFNDMAISLNKSYLSTFEKSNSRIDYIFVNKNTELKGYTVEKIYLSDHYPVIGYI
ncbi:endonuclease/exonuclease/phosphatase [Clostridioides difficile]|uniref:endonuclease/exonuclease/phosphatase family protein n=1 Tax=Clostridioides difficile TaxID=1496 RepID=UPI0003B28FA1|nr:endonuclease/exonuclease/phosphatase family protein [Clostridioides difficile]MCE0689474.1 endonuclease/exonuclease/phosphatase family protein [Clostridioides difficile]MCE0714218.1 endonuclease/exonuclease/phosphatase family protein [Clostridioides difficile]MCE0720669.1 endonuclease/exonuclease/phosphatase family protein [Clostridioides difficile]MCE0728760.1 endonuclease/exonuclease/phosphatase family protein [Clostridioides difficile]QPL00506.1 endonuclease/exonuclease/phosphatase [Clos